MTVPGQPPQRRRRRPVQARSRATVDFVLEAAARVFKREGFAATTNRIAEAAGVSIGTLYEYFPHKQALLRALAERHVELAETELQAACSVGGELRQRLAAVQQAILHCQRFPSQALSLLADEDPSAQALRQRARELQGRLLDHLTALAAPQPDANLRARAAFGALGELSARILFEPYSPEQHVRLAALFLDMAVLALRPVADAHSAPGR